MVPRVDVVIPTRNRVELTGQAIESVLAQDVPDLRITVVDDASDDGSAAALAEAFAADSRVQFLLLERQTGPSGARQQGFEATSSPYVALLDSDDLWRPGKLQRQLELLEQKPAVDVVLCGHEWLDAAGRRVRASIPKIDSGRAAPLATDNMDTPLMRREAIVRAGGFATRGARYSTCETIDFHVRLSSVATYAVVDEVLVTCRAHSGGRASDRMSTRSGATEMVDMIERLHPLLEGHPDDLAALEIRAAARLAVAGSRREALRYLSRGLRRARGVARRRLVRRYVPSIVRHVSIR